MSHRTQRVAVGEVRSFLAAFGTPTPQSARRFDQIAGRFETFMANGFEIECINEVTHDHAAAFVHAKATGSEVGLATKHLRRSTLRLLFRIARLEFDYEGDPTLDLVLPPRSSLSARPLTDDEIAVGRSFSQHTLTATRQPAAWALGEATATTSELPHVTIDDLDLDNPSGPRAWLSGSRKRNDRWGQLTTWGATQLELRASTLRGTNHLIYQGDGSEESQQVSCCIAIGDTLVRSGLNGEPDIHPMSLPGWAGRQIYEETQRIEYVARRLGTRSIDAAARIIALNWQE